MIRFLVDIQWDFSFFVEILFTSFEIEDYIKEVDLGNIGFN